MTPSGRRTTAHGKFPETREQAMEMAELLLHQMWAQGCTCRDGCKIEFCAPPLGERYIQVEHHPLCPLARTN